MLPVSDLTMIAFEMYPTTSFNILPVLLHFPIGEMDGIICMHIIVWASELPVPGHPNTNNFRQKRCESHTQFQVTVHLFGRVKGQEVVFTGNTYSQEQKELHAYMYSASILHFVYDPNPGNKVTHF